MSDGFVKLVNWMVVPGDPTVVNCARQSYGRRLEGAVLNYRDIKVIDMMMDKRHGTPFEGPVFQFHIRCTIKEARDWFRYRAGSSFNEYSTRFSKRIQDEYIPTGTAIRKEIKVDGVNKMVAMTDPFAESITQEFMEAYEDSTRHYQNLLDYGLAQEVASYVYPLGQMTEFTWTANARTLMNFWAQRMDEAALLELRRKSYQVFGLVEPHMPETLALWTKYRQPDMYTDWLEGDPWLPEELR